MKKIGIFGGTFDPVHIGHLRMALELKRALGLDEMRLLPCHIPPHRERPGVNSKQRARMVELAVAQCAELSVDLRELERTDICFSIDTLEQIRQEIGPDAQLVWSMGGDSLINLPSWHRWDQLLDVCHIAVAERPGFNSKDIEQPELSRWLEKFEIDSLPETPAGHVWHQALTLLPVSATEIRDHWKAGKTPYFLQPDPVLDYIKQHQLYR